MLQAAVLDCQFLDLSPFPKDGLVASEVDVGGCDVVQALVITLVVVVIDEGPDLAINVAWPPDNPSAFSKTDSPLLTNSTC